MSASTPASSASLHRIVFAAALGLASMAVPIAQAQSGLNVSLVTSGYEFTPGLPTPGLAAAGPTGGGRTSPTVQPSFTANVAVQNLSRAPITFTFPDAASAARKWTFHLYDAAGAEVWSSETVAIATGPEQTLTLARGQSWRRTVTVPLLLPQLGDATVSAPLAAGLYTLEATLDADKSPAARTVISVLAAPAPDPTRGTLRGSVVRVVNGSTVPSPSAFVSVTPDVTTQPATAGPVWSGVADANGQFAVSLPAGRYHVRAMFNGPVIQVYPRPPVPSGTATVDVAASATTDVTVTLQTPVTTPETPTALIDRGRATAPAVRP